MRNYLEILGLGVMIVLGVVLMATVGVPLLFLVAKHLLVPYLAWVMTWLP